MKYFGIHTYTKLQMTNMGKDKPVCNSAKLLSTYRQVKENKVPIEKLEKQKNRKLCHMSL